MPFIGCRHSEPSGNNGYQDYLGHEICGEYLFDQGSWIGVRPLDGAPGLDAPLILCDSMGYRPGEPLLVCSSPVFDTGWEWSVHYYPGRVVQQGNSHQATFRFETLFADNGTILTVASMLPAGEQTLSGSLSFQFPLQDTIVSGDPVKFLSNSVLRSHTPGHPCEVSEGIPGFRVPFENGRLRVTLCFIHQEGKRFPEPEECSEKEIRKQYEARWAERLTPFGHLSGEKSDLAVKSVQTLMLNWRSPSGDFKHDGVFPSVFHGYFNGYWAWDSWKHAAALALFEPRIAQEQIRVMFSFQEKSGMIPDVVYRDSVYEKPNRRNTKPPLAAWAVSGVFRETGDSAFIREMFPALLRYHRWWYRFRDHNGNGLCEYGSTDGTLVAAAWESGMDNAVRFDDVRMVQNSPGAWSMDQESVDLNCYLYDEKIRLAGLAQYLGRTELSDSLETEAAELKRMIQTRFWDEETGWFYDFNLSQNNLVRSAGPEGWIPLFCGVASQTQAEKVCRKLLDTLSFNTYCPFPTLDASHPGFNPQKGYWRGPVWIDQAAFAIEGLMRYGFEDEAEMLYQKLLTHARGVTDAMTPLYENYHPLTGETLNASWFSWSAAHFLLLLDLMEARDQR
ncbi:MAG: alpha-glucosidase [Bacteroidales bacterium]